MSDKTKIEWTDATWNPVRARNRATGKTGWHCVHVSEGCRNCYAEKLNQRLGAGLAFKPGHEKDVEIFLDEKMLTQPLRWKKPRMIFVHSMTDTFADFVKDEWLDRIFAVMALAPQHTFQVLTKRPERMREYLTARNGMGNWNICHAINGIDAGLGNRRGALEMPLQNVWLGVSVEDQSTANERIPVLLDTPAALRWISAEPLLGAVDLTKVWRHDGEEIDALTGKIWRAGAGSINSETVQRTARLDWIVAGGESQHGSRPSHPDWFRHLRDQCANAIVPFLFKQWGDWLPFPRDDLNWFAQRHAEGGFKGREDIRYVTDMSAPEPHWPMQRVGKTTAGRMLDGVEHNGFPSCGF